MTEEFTDSFGRKKSLKHRFHRESRTRYRVADLKTLFANDYELLIKYIEHHRTVQRPRLIELMDYAQGMNHTVSDGEQRRNESDMADYRAIHDFGGMTSTFKEGYLAGIPIRVTYKGDEKSASEVNSQLLNIAKTNGFDKLNRMLILDMSRVGRAYEIVYRRKDDKTIVRKLNPFETFVIFDQTSSSHSVCAVRYFNLNLFDTSKEIIEVYSTDRIYKFELENGKLNKLEEEIHSFGQVPITEYLNDEIGFGDYEKVLNIIDIYDSVQSDTANYMADIADAILAVFGNIDVPDNWTEQQKLDFQKAMRKARLMMFKPPRDNDGKVAGTVDAKYLTKSYDVAGTEAFKTRVENDIHKFTHMPNLSDSNFSGTQSGEALKYKLFGLDQKKTDTQDMLIESLKRRYELIGTIEIKAETLSDFKVENLEIVLTPNLPKALSEIIANFKALGGVVSNETAMELTGIVENAHSELEKLNGEVPELPTYDGE